MEVLTPQVGLVESLRVYGFVESIQVEFSSRNDCSGHLISKHYRVMQSRYACLTGGVNASTCHISWNWKECFILMNIFNTNAALPKIHLSNDNLQKCLKMFNPIALQLRFPIAYFLIFTLCHEGLFDKTSAIKNSTYLHSILEILQITVFAPLRSTSMLTRCPYTVNKAFCVFLNFLSFLLFIFPSISLRVTFMTFLCE